MEVWVHPLQILPFMAHDGVFARALTNQDARFAARHVFARSMNLRTLRMSLNDFHMSTHSRKVKSDALLPWINKYM